MLTKKWKNAEINKNIETIIPNGKENNVLVVETKLPIIWLYARYDVVILGLKSAICCTKIAKKP